MLKGILGCSRWLLCFILVARVSVFCFIDHEPIHSCKFVNGSVGLSGVHATRTTFETEELVKRGGMRGVEINMIRAVSYPVGVFLAVGLSGFLLNPPYGPKRQ